MLKIRGRRFVVRCFISLSKRVANYNPDEPTLAVNSPKTHYAITEEALEVVRSFGQDDGRPRSKNSPIRL